MKLMSVFEKYFHQKPYACSKNYNLSLIENIVIRALMNNVLLLKNIK